LSISSPEFGFRLVALSLGLALFGLLLWAVFVSRREGEKIAARRLGLLAALLPLPLVGVAIVPAPAGELGALFLVAGSLLLILTAVLPIPERRLKGLGQAVPGVDERDVMFSRANLVPGTDRFEEYYRSRPQTRELDDKFRREPGLLAAGSAHFHREGFAAADAAFWTIEMLRPFVEGEGRSEGKEKPTAASGTKLGGERADGDDGGSVSSEPDAMSRFLKGWALKMGAHSVGVTELRDYHLYTHVGRGPDYGKVVELDHPYAIALVMAVQLADLIRRLGYQARAHVDGLYRVICPLVARDAGLGEFGRMGLLMTQRLGPRVRIAVVTTDLPLATDPPAPDLTAIDFCLQCRKCADSCPSRAISFGDPEEDENGVLRWKIDAEACFTLWGRLGTDCARCMAVCPFSHPDNVMHTLVRWGIRNNGLFRKGALWMDDLVYGRRPPPKGDLEWMDVMARNAEEL